MNLLLLAYPIGAIGITLIFIGLILGRLVGTIQKIFNILYRPLSLNFANEVTVYLPHSRQLIMYLRHPRQMILYLGKVASFSFVFVGASLILIAAIIVAITVFRGVLG